MLALLGFWCLATLHCDLEQMPGLGFLACCQHEGSAPHQDNDCNEDGCAVVESGFYKLEEQSTVAAVPPILVSSLLSLIEPVSNALDVGPESFDFAPPELPKTWQFCCRAALPPRAPSQLV